MASRGGRKPYRPSTFEVAFGVVLLIGLPLALLAPRSFDAKFQALIAVFFVALAAGLGIALAKRRRTFAPSGSIAASCIARAGTPIRSG